MTMIHFSSEVLAHSKLERIPCFKLHENDVRVKGLNFAVSPQIIAVVKLITATEPTINNMSGATKQKS